MITEQNYKANKRLLTEAFVNYNNLPSTDIAAKENQRMIINEIISEMTDSLKTYKKCA